MAVDYEKLFGGKEIAQLADKADITDVFNKLNKLIADINEEKSTVEEINKENINELLKIKVADMIDKHISDRIEDTAEEISDYNCNLSAEMIKIYIDELICNIKEIDTIIKNSSSGMCVEELNEIKQLRIALVVAIIMS